MQYIYFFSYYFTQFSHRRCYLLQKTKIGYFHDLQELNWPHSLFILNYSWTTNYLKKFNSPNVTIITTTHICAIIVSLTFKIQTFSKKNPIPYKIPLSQRCYDEKNIFFKCLPPQTLKVQTNNIVVKHAFDIWYLFAYQL